MAADPVTAKANSFATATAVFAIRAATTDRVEPPLADLYTTVEARLCKTGIVSKHPPGIPLVYNAHHSRGQQQQYPCR